MNHFFKEVGEKGDCFWILNFLMQISIFKCKYFGSISIKKVIGEYSNKGFYWGIFAIGCKNRPKAGSELFTCLLEINRFPNSLPVPEKRKSEIPTEFSHVLRNFLREQCIYSSLKTTKLESTTPQSYQLVSQLFDRCDIHFSSIFIKKSRKSNQMNYENTLKCTDYTYNCRLNDF